MIPLRDQEVIRQRFQRDLTSRVRLDYFGQRRSPILIPGRQECVFCEETRSLMEEIASLSDRISLTQHDIYEDTAAAREMGIDKVPATVIRGQANRPLRFFGLPSGNQFPGFIETLVQASTGNWALLPDSIKQLRKLKTDVHLQVLVTPGCPHSPAVAHTAFKLAQQSTRVKVDVIEIAEFPALVQRHNVRVTPTLIIDGEQALPGAMDEPTLVQVITRTAAGGTLPAIDVSLSTPFNPPGSPAAQQQPQRVGASGLILP